MTERKGARHDQDEGFQIVAEDPYIQVLTKIIRLAVKILAGQRRVGAAQPDWFHSRQRDKWTVSDRLGHRPGNRHRGQRRLSFRALSKCPGYRT